MQFDLEASIHDAARAMVTSGEVDKIVKAQVTATLTSIIKDAFSTYSPFGKQLSEAIKTGLSIDPEALGLQGYNRVVLDIVSQRLNEQINTVGREKLATEMQELLGTDAPKELKLSKLIEEFREYAKEETRGDGRCTIILEEASGGSSSRWLYLDPRSGTDKYRCEFSLLIAETRAVVYRIDGKDPSKTIFMGGLYNFARTLFQMYAAGTKLIIDHENFSNELDDE